MSGVASVACWGRVVLRGRGQDDAVAGGVVAQVLVGGQGQGPGRDGGGGGGQDLGDAVLHEQLPWQHKPSRARYDWVVLPWPTLIFEPWTQNRPVLRPGL